MRRFAQQAAQLVLGTRADTTPELDEDERTSLLGECKEDAKDREVAEYSVDIRATVQFHGLCSKNGAKSNGLFGTIEKVYRKPPGGTHVYKVMIVMNNDPIKPVKVRQTNIRKVPDIG